MEVVVSVLLHIFAYGRLFIYKKNRSEIGPQTFGTFQQKSILSNINSQSLTTFGMNALIMTALVTQLLSSMKMNSTRLEDISKYPNYMFVYYNILISPGLIGTLFVFFVFKRNKAIRKTVFGCMKNQIWQLSEN